MQPALTPTSPHPSLCDPPPNTLLTRLAARTAELPLCTGVPGAAPALSASLLHLGSLWLLTLALESPLPPPKVPGSSTPAPSAPAPLARLRTGRRGQEPLLAAAGQRIPGKELWYQKDPAEPPPQAPGAQMTESPAPARSALNWDEEPPPRQLFASRGIPEARRRRGALRWPVAGARRSGPQLQTSWAAVGAGRGVAGRWRRARSEAPPRGLESRDTTGAPPPPEPSRGARKGGARAARVHPLRVLGLSAAPRALRSLFLALFSSVLFAGTQASSTASTLTIVFGKRGIEGFLFLPL